MAEDYSEDYLGVPGLTYAMYQQMLAAANPTPTPAPVPAPAPVYSAPAPSYITANVGSKTVTAPSNFGLPSQTIPSSSTISTTPVISSIPTQEIKQQVKAVADVVAQVIANSPAVISSPANQVPDLSAVQQSAQQVAQAVASIIAPSLPPSVTQNVVENVSNAVAQSPEVKKSGTGQTIPSDVVSQIASNVANTVSSTQYPTANIGGTNVTAPADFGLPTAPTTPPASIEQTTTQPAPGGSYTTQTGVEVPNPGQTTLGARTPTQVTIDINEEKKKLERQSAFDFLLDQFNQYGLGGLVEPLRNLIQENISPSEFTLRLRDSDAYKNRFAANAQRIKSGLRALSEAEYIGLEDQYQNIMKRYGLPETYYAQQVDPKTGIKKQEGFEKFIAGDVSAAELEDRIQTAQNRVINASPEIAKTLRSYYPSISNGDILAYVLNPTEAIKDIQRKVTAAEIGGAAAQAGLVNPETGLTNISQARATELANAGVNKQAAQQGFQTIADILPRGSQLASIYKQSPYTQTTAEQEVFGLAGATEAEKRRKKLTQLEQASFSGQAGRAGGALSRERAGQY